MRYITVDNLRPGHKLAQNLIASNRVLLLKKGKELSPSTIEKINSLGYQGLYIDDEISEGLEIKDVISRDLRIKTWNELQLLCLNVGANTTGGIRRNLSTLKKLSNSMVDEILHNRDTMVNLVDLRAFDDYTYSHSLNVAVLSIILGIELKLSRYMLYELAIGSLIHDFGKMLVDKKVLNKNGKLTTDEFELVKKHSEFGYNYVRDYSDITYSSKIVTLYHHEKYGGGGYPEGISGDSIPLYCRIVSVADVYDALTSDRPYRKAMLPSDAVEYIMSGYEDSFDPVVVDALTRKVAPYPVGTCVRLSTDDVGVVVRNYEESGMRPRIKLIENNKLTNKIVDLFADRSTLNITVQGIVNM